MAKLRNVPRPDKANRTIHLIKVEGINGNNNKYYDMYDTGDGNFFVFFGRVGADPQIEQYPISRWDSKYREKLSDRKGYKDISNLRIDSTSTQQFIDITDASVAKFIADLQRYASNLVSKTYLVSAGAVTLAQIEEAQAILDNLMLFISDSYYKNSIADRYVREVNEILTKLFTVIPRKMKHVKDHLISVKDETILKEIISNEQDNLDTMESQVKTHQLQQQNVNTSISILDAMGLKISVVGNDIQTALKSKLGENSRQFRKAFNVINTKTQRRFDDYVAACKNKRIEELYHGSRNSNWWSILGGGLMIKPTNAVHTGSMFGNANYFASLAKKSIGYTSLSGSYWARGGDSVAYLAVYSAHLGNAYVVHQQEHEHYSFNYEKLRKRGEYDSMHAKAGRSLYNDEFMIYKVEQSTVRYIIEIGN